MKKKISFFLACSALGSHSALWASETVDPATDPNIIVITGTRSARPVKDSPVTVRVIDKREIEATGDLSAADAMTRIVGVTVETSVRTGQTPQIQGFSSKHVLVLINGRPASGRLTDDFDLSRIPASAIERIEVLKGASSVLYGSDAIGGVINIVTKRPKSGLHGSTRLQRDSLHRNEALLSLSGGNETTTARLDLNHQSAPSYDLNPKDIATTGNAYERGNVLFELNTKVTEKIELSTTLAGDEIVSDGISLGAGNSIIDLTTKSIGRSGRIAARYQADDEQLRIDVGEFRRMHKLRDDQRGSDAADRRLDSNETTRDGIIVGSFKYLQTQETTLGVEAADQELKYSQMGDEPRDRQRSSAFIQHEWRALDYLALVPGLRYDQDTQFDEHISKALTLRYDPTSTVALRLNYGEGYRAPSFSELYLNFFNAARGYRVEGNENLSPEHSRSYQFSSTWQPTRDLWMSLGVFDNHVQDLIINIRTGTLPNLMVRYDNVESVRNRGIETSGRMRVASHWLLGFDYMFLDARDEQRKRYLDGRAMHSGSLQARYDRNDLGLNVTFAMNMVSRRPFYIENAGAVSTIWSKPFRAASLRVAKKIGENVETFLGGRNLTDEGQEIYNPVPPRSYFAGIGAEL